MYSGGFERKKSHAELLSGMCESSSFYSMGDEAQASIINLYLFHLRSVETDFDTLIWLNILDSFKGVFSAMASLLLNKRNN